ncbi:MAG: hypothetical protein KIT58_10865 [Planctomycetota bacterium]|nr:hypothetical protein [Planctomycetota bacterium]
MDATTREHERALSGGDPAVIGRLFTAYVRSGQVGQALALVAGRTWPPRGVVEAEQAAWEGELARLAPAWRVAVPESELVLGAAGELADGRFTLLRTSRGRHTSTALLDVVERRVRPAAADPGELAMVVGEKVLCASGQRLTLHAVDPAGARRVGDASGVLVEEARWSLPAGHVRDVSPTRRLVLARRGEHEDVLTLGQGDVRVLATFAGQGVHVDWERGRAAWLEWGERGNRSRPVTLALATCDDPSVVRRLPLPPDPDPPRRSGLATWSTDDPHLTLLRDGRLAITRPLAVLDAERGEWLVVGGDLEAVGLDRTGRHLVCLRRGRLVLVPIAANAGAMRYRFEDDSRSLLAGSPTLTAWHPRADVVAILSALAVDPCEVQTFAGRRLVRLPSGVRPVGWFAGGRGLLLSVFDAGGSLLEAWTPGGEPI